MVDQSRIDELRGLLEEEGGGPLMIKEVAERMDVSTNTAGRYVDVSEAAGVVVTRKYGSARQVWLPEKAPEGK